MTKRVMTFLGWGLSSALFVIGTFALVQDEPPIALAIVFILWGILCLPPLYELTQRLEKYGWTWNAMARLGLALLIPAFLAPGISQKDLSFYQRVPNPFVTTPELPVSTVTPKSPVTESATPASSSAPVTLSGSPLPILKALELKNGQIYVVSDQTSLMASNNPTDIVADIQQMKLIPKGGIFKILKTDVQKDKQWYQVAAFDAAKTPIGNGWINSSTLTEEIVVASSTPIPSAIQSLLPSPQISSSIAAVIARAQASAAASTPNTSPTASLSPLSPRASASPAISAAPTQAPLPLNSPSKVLSNNSKTNFPAHRVSTEPMVDGSRVIIETEDPSISREQCIALVQTYLAKAGGKGQVVVYKPNPKPPWNGRVLAFCFNDLNEKGTIINSFYGW